MTKAAIAKGACFFSGLALTFTLGTLGAACEPRRDVEAPQPRPAVDFPSGDAGEGEGGQAPPPGLKPGDIQI